MNDTRPDESVMRLSSGRVLYANFGQVGINNVLDVATGFDGDLDGLTCGGDNWTADEKRELADHMIGLWTRFRDEAISA